MVECEEYATGFIFQESPTRYRSFDVTGNVCGTPSRRYDSRAIIQRAVRTTFYSYQQYDTTGAHKLSLLGVEEGVQTNFGTSDYQLHTYILGTNDFVTKQPNESLLRAGNLYFESADLGDIARIRFGRQTISKKSGFFLDGSSATRRMPRQSDIRSSFRWRTSHDDEKLSGEF